MRKKSYTTTLLVYSLLVIPAPQDGAWRALKFKKIPPHQTQISTQEFRVQVQASAGPLVYQLPKPIMVRRIRASGEWTGELKINPANKQGQKGFDDYVLRIGLVVPGERRLSWAERMVAPEWLIQLHGLAPKNAGVDRIEFFNLALTQQQIGQRVVHPLSKLLFQTPVATSAQPGSFAIDYQLPALTPALALWLSIDGDDTKSQFTVKINKLELDELSDTAGVHGP